VQYGTTTAYGTTTPLDATLVTSHSVTITGLQQNTTYHYRAVSRDAREIPSPRRTTCSPPFPPGRAVPSRTKSSSPASTSRRRSVPARRGLAGGSAQRPDPEGPHRHLTVDPSDFLTLTNIGEPNQQGLMDLVFDPNFATNHFYYVFYTMGSPNRDRLSRFTANSALTGTVPGSEFVIYQDPQDANSEHHGGALNFGNDGKLYLTTGEHFISDLAQSLSSPRGKILRFNPDGTIPTDNPFHDGNGPNVDSIWALGLRNPYRAFYDAPTGRLYVGDVGGNDPSTAVEELNLGLRGANYGWPICEDLLWVDPLHQPALRLSPQRKRRSDHRRLRLRGPSSGPVPGQLLLRRLRPELDQAPDLDASGNVTGVFN
jgi:hypothetical protein